MVKVYFETSVISELVAVFDTEEMYMLCVPALGKEAERLGMITTESVTEEDLTEALKEY